MLDIINGKVVAKTDEGIFEIGEADAHRAITVHFLELMEDESEDNLDENYHEAIKLYNIGKQIYKSPQITAEKAREDLMPLIDCLIRDTADRRIAYRVMRYVTREYAYRIRELHEASSLLDFFYALRDPIYTTVLRVDPTFELFYRIEAAFHAEIGDTDNYIKENYCKAIKDLEYIIEDQRIFEKAIVEDNDYSFSDGEREYDGVIPGIILMPNTVALWGLELKKNSYITSEEYEPLQIYKDMVKAIYTKGRDSFDVDYEYSHYQGSSLQEVNKAASENGSFNICYYIASRIGSDTMRKRIAKASGINTLIHDYGNSSRRAGNVVLKLGGYAVVIFILYRILRKIYFFFQPLSIIFWILAVVVLMGLLSTPESRESQAMFSVQSPYRRARLEQAKRQERLLTEINENLRKYNKGLSRAKSGFNYFQK